MIQRSRTIAVPVCACMTLPPVLWWSAPGSSFPWKAGPFFCAERGQLAPSRRSGRKTTIPRKRTAPIPAGRNGRWWWRDWKGLRVRSILPGGSVSRRWPPPDKDGHGSPRLTARCAVPGRGGGALNSRASHWQHPPWTGSSRTTLATYLTGHPLILQRPCAPNVLGPLPAGGKRGR